MKQTEIGFIPEEWKVQSIGETFKFSSGKSRPKNTNKEKTDDLNIPIYGGNGILGYTDQVFTKQKHLILGRVGEYCGCIHLTDNSSWISDNALYDKEKLTNDDLLFLKYCFEFMNLNQYSNKMGQPLITQGIINEIKYPIPPLPEQRKIAYILTTIQKAIEQQDKLIKITTELKKALMQKLFTEGLCGEPQKETEIGLVPESWEVENLGLHSNIVTSFPTFAKASAKYSNKEGRFEIHYLKVSDMNFKGNEISFLTSNNTLYTNNQNDFNSGFIKPDSLIFPKRGAAIATNKKRITTKHSILDPNLIGVEPFEKINIKFLFYFFETFDLASLQDNNVIPQLNKHNVAGIKFPLPNISEQELIVKTIDVISQKVNLNKTKKQTLTDLFKTLLHELMTGQRRVNEIEFEGMGKEVIEMKHQEAVAVAAEREEKYG